MNFDALWQSHASAPSDVFQQLQQQSASVPDDALAEFLRLACHLTVEHLGEPDAVLTLLLPQLNRVATAAPAMSQNCWLAAHSAAPLASPALQAAYQQQAAACPAEIQALLPQLSPIVQQVFALARQDWRALELLRVLLEQAKAQAQIEACKEIARKCNNAASALLEQAQRNAADDDAMLALAQLAQLAWYAAGGWMQQERSDWLVARVAMELDRSELAQTHIAAGLALVEANGNDAIERAYLLALAATLAIRAGRDASALLDDLHAQLKAKTEESWLKPAIVGLAPELAAL